MKRIFLFLIIHCSLFTVHCFAQQGVWTWMSGDSVANTQGHFGTQGVFSPANKPPSTYEACEWKDKQGNFWFFGGSDSTFDPTIGYNTLWEYNPNTNEWAWMKGDTLVDQKGRYGALGVPAPTNNPGSRIYGFPSWVDTAGNFWLFGGYGYDVDSNFGEINDLWEYTIATNEWTWMKGDSVGFNTGNYGTFQVESPTNEPPSRCEYSSAWVNETDNTLWMFGGDNTSMGGSFNDMWRYNISTGNWTWMKGTSAIFPPAVYGIKGVEDPANVPSGRWAFGHWKDSVGNFYFFGGLKGVQNSNSCYNDLWKYNVSTNNWTWVSGTNLVNDAGNYGPECVGDTSYCPPARFENRACWTRGKGNFVLYGGSGPGEGLRVNDSTYNDTWNYNVATRQWSWTSGSTLDDQPSVHGIKGVPNPANHPSARDGSNSWTDANGYLWLFGGYEADGFAFSEDGKMYNDLWRWTPDTIPPTPNFTSFPDSGCTPLTVTFTNTSTNSLTYYWDFGDGHDTTIANPTHTYTDSGTYTVKLIASNISACANGAVDSIVKVDLIKVYLTPTGTFTADTLDGCDSLNVQFNNFVINANTFHWSFGDGGTSQLVNPIHSYHTAGTYTATLIAYGNHCNDTIIQQQLIEIDTPVTVHSAFIADTFSGCNPLTVSFTNNSTNGNSFIWNFGDNTTDTAKNPTHIYDSSGTFTVKLITINTNYCGVVIDSVIHTAYITVYPNAHAVFTQVPDSGCAPLNIQFTNTSTNATSYLWNFGDNQTATGTSPSHTYINHGTYPIILIAFGAGGCNDTITFNSIIVDTLPIDTSRFIADTLSGCNPFTVKFTNNRVNGTSYHWIFGDGTSNDSTSPTHTFIDSGTFTITLITTATNDCGTTIDTSIQKNYINVEEPVDVKARFTGQPVIGCNPLTVTFIDSSINASYYYWNFGDGFTDSTKNPKHTYYFPSNGNYTVTLIVSHPGMKCDNPPDTMRLEVEVDSCSLYVPNVFSPNGDGLNDFFNVVADGYCGYHLIIYDRWGLKMFESYDHNNLWNGRVNNTGGKCPDGTYYYIFSAINCNDQQFASHGYLTLIR